MCPNKPHPGGLICGLAKTCVEHDILISKLILIQDRADQWFELYLNARKHRVDIKSPNSSCNCPPNLRHSKTSNLSGFHTSLQI